MNDEKYRDFLNALDIIEMHYQGQGLKEIRKYVLVLLAELEAIAKQRDGFREQAEDFEKALKVAEKRMEELEKSKRFFQSRMWYYSEKVGDALEIMRDILNDGIDSKKASPIWERVGNYVSTIEARAEEGQ